MKHMFEYDKIAVSENRAMTTERINRMRNGLKLTICILLALLILTACGRMQGEEQSPANTPIPEPTGILKPVASFQAVNHDLSELLDYIWVEDSLVYREWGYDQLNAERQNSYWRIPLDGTGSPELIVQEENGLEVFCICADRNDFLYLFGRERQGEEKKFFLKKQTLSGEELYKTEVDADIPDDNLLYQLYADGQGNLALLNISLNMLFLFDNEGQYKGKGAVSFIPSGLADGGTDGAWLWIDEWGTGITALRLDFEKGSVGQEENLSLPSQMSENSWDSKVLLSGCELGLLVSTEHTLWQYHLASGEAKELFRWDDKNLNINGIDISELRVGEAQGDGLYRMRLFQDGAYRQEPETAEISYVDQAYLPEKKEITLGTTFADAVEGSVRRFNRSSREYYVKIREYEQTKNPLETMLFDPEGIPDIIEVSDIQREILESKGLLENLEPYVKQSGSFQEEDILKAVWTADHANGKLTALTTRFTISTLGMSAKGADASGLTVDKFLQLAAEEQGDFLQYNYSFNMLRCVLEANLNHFVDWEKGKCSFDSPEFIALLEAMNRISYAQPQQGRFYNTLEEELDDFLRSNGQVKFEYLLNLKDYQDKCTKYRNKAVFAGYPTMDGNICHIISATEQYSIYRESKCKDGAWAFISFLLSEAEQKRYAYEGSGFPVRQDAMEYYMEQPVSKYDKNGNPVYDYLTEENRAEFEKILESLAAPQYTVTALRSILTEELDPFFAGDKTASEVAAIIQNRAQLYLDENTN